MDGQLDPQESAFLRLLIDFEERPNAELAYLRQYSERWQQMDKKVPEFFRVAVESDAKNKTDTARGIMREIQFIGNNCAVTDTRFAGSEVTIIRRYLRFLEEYLDEKTGGAAAWLEP